MRITPSLLAMLAMVGVFSVTNRAEAQHFLAEFGTGIASPSGFEPGYNPGVNLGVTLGLGGKFRGNPTRIFFITSLRNTSFVAEREHNGRDRTVSRGVTSYKAGVRFLWPIYGRRLRLLTDLQFGRIQMDSESKIEGLPDNLGIRDVRADLGFTAGIGLQYRLNQWVSLGGRVEHERFTSTRNIDPAAFHAFQEKVDPDGVNALIFTTTIHF